MDGKLIEARVAYYSQTSILVTEGRALRDRVNVAIQTGCNKIVIVIEGDNQIMIQAVKVNIQIH